MITKILTLCLGEDIVWHDRRKAVSYFKEKIKNCPPSSLDREHYERVLSKLEAGRTVARDWD